MNKYFFILFFVSAILLTSCGAVRLASFTSKNVQPGMTKDAVIAKFGQPDRESFHKNDAGELYETLYYTEVIQKGDTFYYDNILDFKEGKLISLSQGPEVRSSDKKITIQKEN